MPPRAALADTLPPDDPALAGGPRRAGGPAVAPRLPPVTVLDCRRTGPPARGSNPPSPPPPRASPDRFLAGLQALPPTPGGRHRGRGAAAFFHPRTIALLRLLPPAGPLPARSGGSRPFPGPGVFRCLWPLPLSRHGRHAPMTFQATPAVIGGPGCGLVAAVGGWPCSAWVEWRRPDRRRLAWRLGANGARRSWSLALLGTYGRTRLRGPRPSPKVTPRVRGGALYVRLRATPGGAVAQGSRQPVGSALPDTPCLPPGACRRTPWCCRMPPRCPGAFRIGRAPCTSTGMGWKPFDLDGVARSWRSRVPSAGVRRAPATSGDQRSCAARAS